ncbi:DUF6049 family protein [Nonomuraea cavernae]|uniref:DUF6049 family protein n=1 Tax=Nonomuraea cavernae TaxID=2045107 RepID=UPI0033D68253
MIRKVTVLAALSTTLLAPLVATTPDTAAATTVMTARQGLELTVTSVTPEYTTGAADEIKISGTIRNDTGAAMPGLRVQLRYSAQRLADRAAIDSYLADQTPPTLPGNVSTSSSMDFPALEAGASATWEITRTPAQLQLNSFGVYPVAVEVLQQGWRSLGVQRTLLTYAPPTPQKPPRNRLAVVLPIIDQPHRADDATFTDDKLSAALTGKGRLADLARIAKSAPKNVTWVVDPALLDDAQAMTKPYSVSTKDGLQKKSADGGATQWLTDLRSALANSPVVATPYADPDVAALAHRGFDSHTGRAIELGGQKARELLKPDVQTNTAWPPAGLLDPDALDLLSVGKPGVARVTRVLLNSTNVPPQPPVSHTPDAAMTLDSVAGPVTALIADPGLSRALEPDSSVSGSVALSRQRFVAETAMISAEPGQTQARSLVMAPSRRWDPNPTLVSSLLKTAAKLPWLTLTPLSSIKPATTQVPRAGLTYTEQDRKEELGAKYLDPVKEVAGRAQLTSGIMTGKPQSDFDAAVLRLTSSAWRNQTRAGRAMTKIVDSAVQSRMNKISITGADPDRPRTLAGADGVVPISVKNSLPDEVTVDIDVTSNSPARLQIDYQAPKRLVIGGNGQSGTLQVPMKATMSGGSGDATVNVQLRTADGKPYGKPVKLTIRTTGYTGIALVIVGAALTVMFAAVVTRVLRRRSQRRLQRATRTRESETV